jgi:predicted nucleic acid-binding protein
MYPNVDFDDVLLVAHSERLGISQITSFDQDFDDIKEIERIEPSKGPAAEPHASVRRRYT